MSEAATNNHDETKPLDPAAEKVRRKLVRFMFVNLGILVIALMAVMGALVYKSFTLKPQEATSIVPPSSEMQTGMISLPVGTEILSQSLSGNRLSLYLRNLNGEQRIVIYDLNENRVVSQIELLGQQ